LELSGVFDARWLGRQQLVNLIQRRDDFATGYEFFEIIAAGQLVVFQKLFPKVRRNTWRGGIASGEVGGVHLQLLLALGMPPRSLNAEAPDFNSQNP